MRDWPIVKAEEFCFKVTDGTHDSPKAQSSGRKLITSKHLKGHFIDFDSANLISEEDYVKIISRSAVEQWDILYSMIGTIGNIYIEKSPNVEYACKNMGIFKFGGKRNDSLWMYYYLKSPQANAYIQANLRGSTQAYVPLGALRNLPITLPPMEDRIKIISILRSIDERIEANHAINDNLQQQLQAIYQEMYGKHDQMNGTLADLCCYAKSRISVSELSCSNYYSTENMLPNKQGYTDATSLPTTELTPCCHPGNVLISNIRPYFKKIVFCDSVGGCSADVLCFESTVKCGEPYLFSTLYADAFFDFMVAGSKGTKMPRGDKQQIMQYPVHVPNETEVAAFGSIANPILARVAANRIENQRLAELRDTLLPKLMSGEVDVTAISLGR